jgi:PKHD-type hydroxylase
MGPDADIAGHVSTFASVANRQSFGFDLTSPYDIQCLEYHGADGGKFDWHQDVTWTQSLVSSRKLSFIAQLSDPADYEGGDFEFWGYPSPPPEFRNKGAVLVFPSFLHHRVLPVTKGVRYALVSWIEGPKFR